MIQTLWSLTMTKTLTEQWREGMLENGRYYVKDWDGTIYRFVAQNKILWRDSNNPIYASERIEVLAPVPSYDEYKRLQDQLADLSKKVKTLKGLLEHALQTMGQIAKLSEDKVDAVQCATSICLIQERLKEMEGVK